MSIKCKNLTKKFGRVTALDGLSLEVAENTIVGLIGRNGAGKTTLLKTIAGYLKPTGGDISVFGFQPFNNLTVSANTIFVDDNMVFPAAFSLDEILNSVSRFYENWDMQMAVSLCEYFGLNLSRRHSNLSKGQESTFNSIIGIASHCPLTLYDEPTTGMDSSVRKDFYRALLKDYIDYPRTIILSSHLLGEIDDLLENIILIKEGKLCLHMSADEIKEYAIGLRGNMDIINEKTSGMQIIHEEIFPSNNIYRVVKNILSPEDIRFLKQNNIEITAVSADSLCIYLTENNKGGIDSVFTKNKSVENSNSAD
jgi:ABC-2 type transport system ATP-binding protein